MRIARILFDDGGSAQGSDALGPRDPSPVPFLAPRVALERDGALYDAGALDRIFDTQFSPVRLAGACDFHTRTAALGGAGLAELDERLRSGDRPSEARLVPGSFTWLAPCDTDRALLVQMALYDERLTEPAHRLGDARGLLGHGSCVPFPAGELHPAFELGIAAVLRDDLRDADAGEASRAILGYTILNTWTGRDDEARRPAWAAPRVPTQLGPVLVTPDDLGDVGRLKALVRVDGAVTTTTDLRGWTFSIAESIAWVSRWIDLRAGDVIGAGRVPGGRGDAAFGVTTELAVERLGKLRGRPVQREPGGASPLPGGRRP